MLKKWMTSAGIKCIFKMLARVEFRRHNDRHFLLVGVAEKSSY
jgi:hypothetical protein